jgi:hypothetical protein
MAPRRAARTQRNHRLIPVVTQIRPIPIAMGEDNGTAANMLNSHIDGPFYCQIDPHSGSFITRMLSLCFLAFGLRFVRVTMTPVATTGIFH